MPVVLGLLKRLFQGLDRAPGAQEEGIAQKI